MDLSTFILAAMATLPRSRPAADVLPAIYAAATELHVPPQLVLATCAMESGLRPRGLLCGVYRVGQGTREQAMGAARILRMGLTRCHTWAGAVTFHYSGRCASHAPPRRGVQDPITWGERIAALALRMGN